MLLRRLFRNVRAGLRLALFMRVRPLDFRVSAEDYAALVVLNLLVWIACGVFRGGFPGYIEPAALYVPLVQVPLTLSVCLIIARMYRRSELLLAFALLLIASDPLFEVAGTALQLVARSGELPPGMPEAMYYAYVAWSVIVILRVQALLTRWQPLRGFATAALLLGLLAFFVLALPRSELWQPARDDGRDPVAAITDETVFLAQTPLLVNQLESLEPERPGITDLYFLGMAPFGTQDVFARELAMVDEVLGRRFDTAGRNVLLSNHPETLGELPVATVTHLRLALSRLATVMNPDEDILMLFITTHGTEQHQLVFELPPMGLVQLTPAALSRILADSGIKWKVLVISACYSGGFLEPLKDDNTLVITAAASDRQSFGCGDDEELTHFGRAYFHEALRQTLSFTDGFDIARRSIAARERAGKLEPSLPQMHAGSAMRDKLAELEARLKLRANITVTQARPPRGPLAVPHL